MNKKFVITPEGYSLLQKRIVQLEKAKAETAERLGIAGLDSDASENSSFTALQEKLEEIENERRKKVFLLENAEICPKINNKSSVGLGSIVAYKILNQGGEETVEITDTIEASPPQKISVESPFGKILLGKKIGDILEKPGQGKAKQKIQILEIK